MHSRVTTPLNLLLTALNVRLISPLRATSRNLLQQALGALGTQPLQHGPRLIVLFQLRLV
jgi:hypothetical protein